MTADIAGILVFRWRQEFTFQRQTVDVLNRLRQLFRRDFFNVGDVETLVDEAIGFVVHQSALGGEHRYRLAQSGAFIRGGAAGRFGLSAFVTLFKKAADDDKMKSGAYPCGVSADQFFADVGAAFFTAANCSYNLLILFQRRISVFQQFLN